jgi:hypothetical protein
LSLCRSDVHNATTLMTPKVRMFYGALSTDFSTACVEKCFKAVAEKKFRVPSFKLRIL